MKLSEIRERYLSLQISTGEARAELLVAGVDPLISDELLSLWLHYEWDGSTRDPQTETREVLTGHVTYGGRQYRVTVEEE